jgi:predicted permease
MKWLRAWLLRLVEPFRKEKREREFSAEMESHLELHIEDNLRAGMTTAEARRQALIKLGGVEQTKESYREQRGLLFLEVLLQDLRFSARMFIKNPGFAAVAVLTLALGIGANTAIFTLLDAVVFRRLPARDPQQLVLLQWHAHKTPEYNEYSSFGDCTGGGSEDNPWGCSFSSPMFDTIRAQARVFDGVLAFGGSEPMSVNGNGPASMASAEIVSGDYFQTLGVRAAAGRTIEPTDDAATAPPVVVISYGYWQTAFGGAPSVIGRTIDLNRVPFTIVGIADRGFTNLSPGKTRELYLTRSMFQRVGTHSNWSRIDDPGNAWLVILARLKPGISRAQAQSAVSLVYRNELSHGSKPLLEAKYEPSIVLLSANDGLTAGTAIKQPLYVLMLAVGIILMIACANVAGLLLARATVRQREMAVRFALGAPRIRIVRQLITESVLLSVSGGVVGVLVAYWGVRVIVTLVSGGSAGAFPFAVTPDLRIMFFTAGISVFSGMFFGLVPALHGSRLDLMPALKKSVGGSQSSRDGMGRWLSTGSTLAVAQIALAVVVLAGAGLLVRTLNTLDTLNPGFDSSNVLLFGLDPALLDYRTERIQDLYRELQAELAALPGVISVSYSADALLSGSIATGTVGVEGQPDESELKVDSLATGPGFFETMRIPVLAGRAFDPSDFAAAAPPPEPTTEQASDQSSRSAPKVTPVLVNEEFVRRYCKKHGPLGMRLTKGNSEHSSGNATRGNPRSRIWVIVGVVGDAKYDSLRREIQPTVYGAINGGGAHFELRTAVNPASLIFVVRKTVSHLDGNLPLSDVSTQSEEIHRQLSHERFIARLSSLFGLLALLLASIGVYGLLSYDVGRRTREIGIRMALGANRRSVLRLVVRQGIRVAASGVTLGIVAALAVTRYLQSFLYGVRPGDPWTMLFVCALLLLVVFAACYGPAQRAMRVDPMVALRYE